MKTDEIKQMFKYTNRLIYILMILVFINIIITINNKPTKDIKNDYDTSSFTNIKIENIEEYVSDEEYKLVMIGKPSCEYSIKMLPIVKKVQEEYNIDILYVDHRTINEKNSESLLKYDDETSFISKYINTTPFIIIFKENKMLDTWVGYNDYSTFVKFLEELNIEKKEN